MQGDHSGVSSISWRRSWFESFQEVVPGSTALATVEDWEKEAVPRPFSKSLSFNRTWPCPILRQALSLRPTGTSPAEACHTQNRRHLLAIDLGSADTSPPFPVSRLKVEYAIAGNTIVVKLSDRPSQEFLLLLRGSSALRVSCIRRENRFSAYMAV